MERNFEFVPVDYLCFAGWRMADGGWRDLENLRFSYFGAWRSCESKFEIYINSGSIE
jgi:hypothetical protein